MSQVLLLAHIIMSGGRLSTPHRSNCLTWLDATACMPGCLAAWLSIRTAYRPCVDVNG